MKCSDKEWQHCQKEKLGCKGCAYNDEIKIGEYIRNTFGDIYKYDYIGHPMLLGDEFYNRIVKHSKNIIDLIQKDDYVNGEKIVEKFYDYANKEYHLVTRAKHYFSEDIKTILTKEMFEANLYKLEEK